MILDIVVEPDGDGFHAYCPMLPGLHVAGDTEKEALKHAGDALSAYMESMIKHGDPLPHSRSEARRFKAQRKGESTRRPRHGME